MAIFGQNDPVVKPQEAIGFGGNDPVVEEKPRKKVETFGEKDKVVAEQKPDETGMLGRAAETTFLDLPLSGLQGILETVRGFASPLREMREKEEAALAESYKKYGVQPKTTAPAVTDQDLQDAIAKLQSYKSEGTKAAEVKRSEAKGAAETIATYLKNPSLISTGTAEMLAPMITGGVLGRLFGKVGMPFNYAAGEGVVAGVMNAQQIRDSQGGAPLTPEQQLNVAESIALTTAFSAFGGAVANRLGVGDFDEIISGAARGQLSQKAQSKLKSAVKSAIIEGGVEELPQSIADQITQNVATNRPWDEGVGEAAASGLVLGSVPGFGAGFYTQAKINKQLLADAENKEAETLQAAMDTKRQGYTDSSKEWFGGVLKEGRRRRAEQEKLAAATETTQPEVIEEVPGEVAPSEPGILDAATLKTFGLNPRSNAYKLLLNSNTSTATGQQLLNDVLEAYSGNVDYDAVTEYLQTVPQAETIETEVPNVEEVISEVQSDEGAGGASVSKPSKRGRGRVAPAVAKAELGGMGAASSDVGELTGGEGRQLTPLEEEEEEPFVPNEAWKRRAKEAEDNYNEVEAEFDKITSNEKSTQAQINAIDKKLDAAYKQLRRAQFAENPPEEITSPPAPEANITPIPDREAPPGFEWYQEVKEDGRITEGLRRVEEAQTEEVVPEETAPEETVEEAEEPALDITEEELKAAPVEEVEEVEEEEVAPNVLRPEGKAIAAQLRVLDPYHPLIPDLVSPDVDESTIEVARQALDEAATAKAARRPVAPEEEAAAIAADQELEDQVDNLVDRLEEIKTKAKDTIAQGIEQALNTKATIAPEDRVSLNQVLAAVADLMYVYIKQGVKSMGAAISKARQELGPRAKRLTKEQMVQAYNMAAARVASEKPQRVARGPQAKVQKADATQKNQRAKQLFKSTGLDVPTPSIPSPFQEFTSAPIKYLKQSVDRIMTRAFSFDYAINKKMIAAGRKQGASPETIRQAFLESQVSQAVSTDAQYDQFRTEGGMVYNPSIFKFESFDAGVSQQKLETLVSNIAKKYGVDPEEFRKYASAALQARRSQGLIKYNAKLRRNLISLVERGNEAKARKDAKNYKYVNMTPSEIKAGLKLFEEYPELYEVVDMWNEIRANVLNFVMQQGIYSKEQIEDLLDVMDYVPFYTVAQVEANADPKQYIRALLDTSRDKRLKGSTEKVNDIFDNMDRWARHMVKKALVNRVAQDKIKWYKTFLPDDIKPIADTKQSLKGNYVSIWEDGKLTRYDFQGNDGKTMVEGFTGAEPLILSGSSLFGDFMRASNGFLRASIVYNPMFAVAQVPMDTWTAMHSSGISNPYGLMRQVIQEIPLTLLNLSSARKELKKTGFVGFHDLFKEYNATSLTRENPSFYTSLKKVAHKLSLPLQFLSIASDNVVRQAVYKQLLKETGDKAMAINAAAEIINFRRSGSSPILYFVRQFAPFYNANFQAQYVAMGTVLDGGINNKTRAESFKRVLGIGAKLMPLYLGYAILKSGDDDYEKLSPAERDGFFIINDSLRIPLRMDIFTLAFKVVTEHAFNTFIAQTEDATKMKEALKKNLIKAIALPSPVPPVGTSVIENVFNIDLINNRPLVGRSVEGLEEELQYSAKYTSELAKVLAEGTGVSPIAVDNLLRDIFGTVYGISNLMLNKFIAEQRGVVLPEKTTRENIAGWPSMSKFIPPEFGARNVEDFYEVLDKVNKVVKSYSELSKISPKRAEEYLNRDDNRHVILSKGEVNALSKQLSVLRAYEKTIREEDMGRLSAQGKADELRRIEELRQSMLGNKVGPKEQRYIQDIRFRLGM